MTTIDHNFGRDSSAVKSVDLPSSGEKYLKHTDLYLDARRIAAIPPCAREKKNAYAPLWYNCWLHLPEDVRSATQCSNVVRPDMPYIRCKEGEDYQLRVNKLLLDLCLLYTDP